MRTFFVLAVFAGVCGVLHQTVAGADDPTSVTWRFDRLDQIGGHRTTILGQPKLIDTPEGKAVQFDGVQDALFVEDHPLAGAETFTWEVIFRPDADGKQAQRFFHLAEKDASGADSQIRMLFEIRLNDGQWCLDSFDNSTTGSQALMDPKLVYPAGRWYHAAAVYDGREYRNYVDGKLQVAAQVKLSPQGQGHSSIGVRINKVDYFKGAVRLARMTKRALPVQEFLTASSR